MLDHSKKDVYYVKDSLAGNRIDYKDRDSLINYYFRLFLNKTQSMFEWKNLPETIIQRDMELLIQTYGYGVFLEYKGKYYVLWGTVGGRQNFNYMPTRAVVANPYLREVSGSYEVFYGYESDNEYPSDDVNKKGDCVVIPNDALYVGIEPILNYYANRMTDTYISRRIVTIMSRYINVFVAKDNNVHKNVLEFLKKVEEGELAAIYDESNQFMSKEAVSTLPLSDKGGASRMITELIEAEQYDKASLYNELGLQANYNMKREAINSNESQLNQDALFPLVDTMLQVRKLACERINKKFGLNLSVDFSSAWKYTREEIEAELAAHESEAEEKPVTTDSNDEKKEEVDEGKHDSDSAVDDDADDVGDGGSGGK